MEPFRGALRQGDWKLIWRALNPTSVDLYNLAEDLPEKNNLAAAHPDKVTAMQERITALGKESAKPLTLIHVAGLATKHSPPLMASEDGSPPATIDENADSITDEGFGDPDIH